MYISEHCFGLFIDANDTLYCSIANLHQVIAKAVNNEPNALSVVVGTGCAGSAPIQLNSPRGIFIDNYFGLYVADCGNHRIQYFRFRERNATTVAGNGAPGTITLHHPTDIVLDADEYLYIVDHSNHRIVQSGPHGSRCIIGCFVHGSAPDQLSYPNSMAFDTDGNIFVVDHNNHRIRKFILINDYCGEFSCVPTRKNED